MSRLLARSGRRYARRHPLQWALAVLGVGLGVAVVLGVEVSLQSARTGFRLSTEAVTGSATHQIVGGPGGVPFEVWQLVQGSLAATVTGSPIVEGSVGLASSSLRLLGLDPSALFSDALAAGTSPANPLELEIRLLGRSAQLLLAPGAANLPTAPLVLTADRAERLAVSLGDVIEITTSTGEHAATVVGILTVSDELQRQAFDDVAFTTTAVAAGLLGQPDTLSRIDLMIPEASADETLAALGQTLPGGIRIVTAAARRQGTLRMTEAFEINLRALGLLALLCGAFLVYGAMTVSVVERRGQIGLLRALGVSRREVLTAVLGEVTRLAAAGTILGAIGGVALASALVHLVTRTVSDLYFTTAVRHLDLDPLLIGRTIVLGLAVSLVAGLRPALEATRVPPRLSLQAARRDLAPPHRAPVALAGTGLLLLGGLGLFWAGRSLLFSFAALFATSLGFALLVPPLAAATVRALEPMMRRRSAVARMAGRGLARSLGRTGVALSALTLAVATSIGVGVMVTSFRQAVSQWLGDTLRQDLYVSATVGSERIAWHPSLLMAARALPGVDSVHTIRRVQLEGRGEQGRPTEVVAVDTDRRDFDGYRLLGRHYDRPLEPDALWQQFRDRGAALVSEPLAFHRGLAVGDHITLDSDRGPRALAIVGVYRDYSSDRGQVLLHRRTWDRLFDDPRVDGASLRLAPDADLESVREALGATLPSTPVFAVRSARGLREAALEVFDRTFLITGVLRLLVGLVAFLGVLAALLAALLERRREHAVLRAMGFSGTELRRLLVLETTALGAIAGVLALPLGIGLAWAMIHVVNRRSFGWSMEMTLTPGSLLQGLALALAAAWLAGLAPGRRLLRTAPATALRAD